MSDALLGHSLFIVPARKGLCGNQFKELAWQGRISRSSSEATFPESFRIAYLDLVVFGPYCDRSAFTMRFLPPHKPLLKLTPLANGRG